GHFRRALVHELTPRALEGPEEIERGGPDEEGLVDAAEADGRVVRPGARVERGIAAEMRPGLPGQGFQFLDRVEGGGEDQAVAPFAKVRGEGAHELTRPG